MALENAQQYLTNALTLIERYEADGDAGGGDGGSGGGGGGGSGSSKRSGGGGGGGGSSGASSGGAVGGPPGRHLSRMLQAVLVNLQYVSLCLNNPVQVVAHAKRLLAIPDCDLVKTVQARLYCAEAQCLLSRLADAQRTLAECPTHGGVPLRERLATFVALGNVHILQQNLAEADEVVRRALKLRPGHAPAIRLMVYINLKTPGRMPQVLNLIKTREVPPPP